MYEFSLDTDPDDMEAADLRETLTDFMQKHEDNVGELENLRATVAEYEDVDLDDLKDTAGKVEQVQERFAEDAAEYTNLDAEMIVERFSLEETIELAGEAAEAADEEQESKFSEKGEKGEVSDDTKAEFSEEIDGALDRIFG